MTVHEARPRSRAQGSARLGWGLLVTVGAVLMINGGGLFLFIADTQIFRTAGLLLGGFGLLAMTVALDGLLHGTRWAWNASWLIVAVLAVLTVHTVVGGDRAVAILHISYVGAALVGLMLARVDPRLR